MQKAAAEAVKVADIQVFGIVAGYGLDASVHLARCPVGERQTYHVAERHSERRVGVNDATGQQMGLAAAGAG